MLVRIGRWSHRRRRIVLAGWIALLVGISALTGIVGTGYSDTLEVPDSETRDGFDLLEEHFDGVGNGQSAQIVFRADQGVDDPEVRSAMEGLFAEVDAIEGVTVTSPYDPAAVGQIAFDGPLTGQVAYAVVDLHADIDETRASEIGVDIRDSKPEVDGLEVLTGGYALEEFVTPEAEFIGLGFAVVILIVAFGSVLAMGLPIGVAVVGVGTGLGLTALISNVQSMPEFATTIGAMIGLGVGIDYALFIVTRYREARRQGRPNDEAMLVAIDTAGRAVVFAGITVIVSLLGLLLIGLSFVAGLGIAAAVTVLCTMAASITLLPALVGFAGERIEITRRRGLVAAGFVACALVGYGLGIPPLLFGLPLALVTLVVGTFLPPLRRELPARTPKPRRQTLSYRFSRVVQRRPWFAALGGAGVLLVLALPILGLRLGFSDEGNLSEELDARQAYDLVAEAFGPGFNGPLLVTVGLDGPAAESDLDGLVAAIEADEGVFAASPARLDDPGAPAAAVIHVVPASAPQDEATEQLVDRLRSEVIPPVAEGAGLDVNITGFTAAGVDFTDYLAERTALFFGAVLTLSFLLLLVVFRSLLVPLKAVIMNALGIAAAYGVVVAVFQWGWLADVVGIHSGAPIEPFIPMMMFAVVFGLSMDYEVFLLSRIREEYERTGDAVESVADGLAATARVITAAAAIMCVVFGSFMFEDDRVIKLFGLGLATAVFLDATLVRMLLVPATMELLGERNWWLPRRLARLVPNVQIEGHLAEELDSGRPPVGEAPGPEEDRQEERVPEPV